jgi:hypothetical protein
MLKKEIKRKYTKLLIASWAITVLSHPVSGNPTESTFAAARDKTTAKATLQQTHHIYQYYKEYMSWLQGITYGPASRAAQKDAIKQALLETLDLPENTLTQPQQTEADLLEILLRDRHATRQRIFDISAEMDWQYNHLIRQTSAAITSDPQAALRNYYLGNKDYYLAPPSTYSTRGSAITIMQDYQQNMDHTVPSQTTDSPATTKLSSLLASHESAAPESITHVIQEFKAVIGTDSPGRALTLLTRTTSKLYNLTKAYRSIGQLIQLHCTNPADATAIAKRAQGALPTLQELMRHLPPDDRIQRIYAALGNLITPIETVLAVIADGKTFALVSPTQDRASKTVKAGYKTADHQTSKKKDVDSTADAQIIPTLKLNPIGPNAAHYLTDQADKVKYVITKKDTGVIYVQTAQSGLTTTPENVLDGAQGLITAANAMLKLAGISESTNPLTDPITAALCKLNNPPPTTSLPALTAADHLPLPVILPTLLIQQAYTSPNDPSLQPVLWAVHRHSYMPKDVSELFGVVGAVRADPKYRTHRNSLASRPGAQPTALLGWRLLWSTLRTIAAEVPAEQLKAALQALKTKDPTLASTLTDAIIAQTTPTTIRSAMRKAQDALFPKESFRDGNSLAAEELIHISRPDLDSASLATHITPETLAHWQAAIKAAANGKPYALAVAQALAGGYRASRYPEFADARHPAIPQMMDILTQLARTTYSGIPDLQTFSATFPNTTLTFLRNAVLPETRQHQRVVFTEDDTQNTHLAATLPISHIVDIVPASQRHLHVPISVFYTGRVRALTNIYIPQTPTHDERRFTIRDELHPVSISLQQLSQARQASLKALLTLRCATDTQAKLAMGAMTDVVLAPLVIAVAKYRG